MLINCSDSDSDYHFIFNMKYSILNIGWSYTGTTDLYKLNGRQGYIHWYACVELSYITAGNVLDYGNITKLPESGVRAHW